MNDPWIDRLSEYLDDELVPAERLQLEQHLLDCARCREVIDELRAVITDAQTLEDTVPARDLWPGIVNVLPRPSVRAAWRVSLSLPQALAASILLMVVSGLAVWTLADRQSQSAGTGSAERESPTLQQTSFRVEDPRYDRAVAELAQLLAERRSRLNPRTVQVLERNLATIDRAIAEAVAAVRQDPADAFLAAHLVEQRRLKLSLLRQAKNFALASPPSD